MPVKKNPVKTATFNGRKFVIDVDTPFDGLCECPYGSDNTPAIRIPIPLNSKKGLVTLLHECLHASQWAKGEGVVDRTSQDIGRLLWRLGYRRVKE